MWCIWPECGIIITDAMTIIILLLFSQRLFQICCKSDHYSRSFLPPASTPGRKNLSNFTLIKFLWIWMFLLQFCDLVRQIGLRCLWVSGFIYRRSFWVDDANKCYFSVTSRKRPKKKTIRVNFSRLIAPSGSITQKDTHPRRRKGRIPRLPSNQDADPLISL